MQVHYSYLIEDFEDICVTADRLVPRSHRIRFASVIAGCLLLVAPFLTSAGITHPDRFLLGMSPFGFCLLACGFQSPRRRARKIYACAVTGMEYDATITDEAIITSSPVARGELKWKAFSRVIEGDDALALVTDAVMYLFPKRAFAPAELEEFKNLISKHVPVWDGKSRTIRLL
jgi:YcxB-like protein